MANAFSIPAQYNTPNSSINLGLVDKVLSSKQGKIDMNTDLLYQNVDKILGVDLIKDEDKQYLNKNLSKVLSTLENTDNIDFSKKATGYELKNAISSSIDDYVLDQISNTKVIREYGETIKKTREDGTYAVQNDWFAKQQAGFDEYLKEGNGVNTLGSLKYTPYKDIKDFNEDFDNWVKNYAKDIRYEDGLFYDIVKKEYVSGDKVRGFFEAQLSPEYRNQLYIDKSFEMKGSSDADIRDQYVGLYKQRVDDLKYQKEAILSSMPYADDEEKTQRLEGIETQISRLNEEIKDANGTTTKKPISRNNALFQISNQTFLDRMENLYSYDRIVDREDNTAAIKTATARMKTLSEAEESGESRFTTNLVETDLTGDKKTKEDSFNTLDTNLEQGRETLINYFSSKDEKFKNEYSLADEATKNKLYEQKLMSLNSIDALNGLEIPDEILDHMYDVKTHAKAQATFNSGLETGTTNLLKALRGGGIGGQKVTFENLKKSYPVMTVIAQKGESYKPTKEEQRHIKLEVLDYLVKEGYDDNYKGYVKTLRSTLISELPKEQQKNYKENKDLDTNIVSAGLSLLGSTANSVFNKLVKVPLSKLSFNEAKIEEAKKDYNEDFKGSIEKVGDFAKAIKNSDSVSLGLPYEIANAIFDFDRSRDSEIKYLDNDEIKYLDQEGRRLSGDEILLGALDSAFGTMKETLDSSEEQAAKTRQITVNPKDATDKDLYFSMDSQITSIDGKYKPDKNENISMYYDKDSEKAYFKFYDETTETIVEKLPIDFKELNSELQKAFDTRKTNYRFDVSTNKNALPLKVNTNNFKTQKDVEVLANSLLDSRTITPEQYSKMIKDTTLPTKENMYAKYSKLYKDYIEDEQIKEIVSANYGVEYVPNTRLGVYEVVVSLDGEQIYKEITDWQVLKKNNAIINSIAYKENAILTILEKLRKK